MNHSYNLETLLARSTDVPFSQTPLGAVLGGLPPLSADGPWLAGGALRRTLLGQEPDADFDFFFRSSDQLADFAAGLEARGLNKLRESEHHVHYRGAIDGSSIPRDVQCIRFAFYADASAVIDSFDYTICMFAFDGTRLMVGEHSLWDLGRRRLAIHRITYPISTMRRLLKYGQQGFSACKGCLSTILTQTIGSPAALASLDVEYVD